MCYFCCEESFLKFSSLSRESVEKINEIETFEYRPFANSSYLKFLSQFHVRAGLDCGPELWPCLLRQAQCQLAIVRRDTQLLSQDIQSSVQLPNLHQNMCRQVQMSLQNTTKIYCFPYVAMKNYKGGAQLNFKNLEDQNFGGI